MNAHSTESWSDTRMRMRVLLPWIYPVAVLVRPMHDPTLETNGPGQLAACIGADGRMRYNNLPEENMMWVLAHECCHLFLDFWKRAKELNPMRFNVAQDIVINGMLASIPGMPTAPTGALTNTMFGFPPNLTSEDYYNMLPEGSGEGGGDVDPDDSSPRAARFREAIQEACRKAGNLPGDFKRVVDEVLSGSRVKWETMLRQAVTNGLQRVEGCTVRNYNRRHRFQNAVGEAIILGQTQGIIPRVMIAVDTSGSMYDLIETIVRETEAIGHAAGAPVDVVVFDSSIRAKCTSKTLRDNLVGWGGTDFHSPIEASKGYAVLVMVTDGMGPAPASPPKGTRVVWALTPGGQNPTDYGRVVQCEVGT